MSDSPIVRKLAELAWETKADQKAEVAALAATADDVGARRSRLTTGEHGFHSHISEMPAGFDVPPHTHDISEHMTILEGSIIVVEPGVVEPGESGDTITLGAGDTTVIPANHLYGFTVGDQGVRFLVVRAADAATQFDPNSTPGK